MANKRLITEADVRAMARGSKLVLGPDALATPSALDAAFELGLVIVRAAQSESAAASACGCGGACGGSNAGGCTWSKMMQQDATYVVVVRGGQSSVTRLTEQGPVPFR